MFESQQLYCVDQDALRPVVGACNVGPLFSLVELALTSNSYSQSLCSSEQAVHQMAATFQYSRQYSWSKIKRDKQPEFQPIATHDEDECSSSEGLLEKGSADSSRATSRPLWKDPTFLIFQGALFSFYLLVLALVAASKGPSCSDAHGRPYCTQLPYVVPSRKSLLT